MGTQNIHEGDEVKNNGNMILNKENTVQGNIDSKIENISGSNKEDEDNKICDENLENYKEKFNICSVELAKLQEDFQDLNKRYYSKLATLDIARKKIKILEDQLGYNKDEL